MMKSISILMAGIAVAGVLTGCKQNTEPRYEDPTEFSLNTPALANQLYELTPEGVIDFTWSQPDWGFASPADYKVQVSLENEFTSDPNFRTLATTYHACRASVSMEEIAIAVCQLRGIEKEEEYTEEPPRPVYFRILGNIPQVAGSVISSNVVCLKQVQGYCAVQSPGKIYLVGSPEGWKGPDPANAAHYADWALYEPADGIGSLVYSNTFALGGAPMFRFYTALTGWDNDSWGSQAEDNPIDFELTNGEFSTQLVKGKGSFNFPAFEGGNVFMEVNMNDDSHRFNMKTL